MLSWFSFSVKILLFYKKVPQNTEALQTQQRQSSKSFWKIHDMAYLPPLLFTQNIKGQEVHPDANPLAGDFLAETTWNGFPSRQDAPWRHKVKLRNHLVGIIIVVMLLLMWHTHTHGKWGETLPSQVQAPRCTSETTKHPQDGDVLSKITLQHSFSVLSRMPQLCRSTSPPGPDVSCEVIIGTTCKDGTLDPWPPSTPALINIPGLHNGHWLRFLTVCVSAFVCLSASCRSTAVLSTVGLLQCDL